MSVNGASHYGYNNPSVAPAGKGPVGPSHLEVPVDWDVGLGRPRYVVDADAGPSATDENGLACYWQDGVPMPPRASLRRSLSLAAKRAFDLAAASLAILGLAPLFIAVAIAIKLTDRGPVFFRQTRIGYNGKPFEILKFRTMYASQCDDSGVHQTVAGDERVMPIGATLRRMSIDELPQLFNIVAGQMSLVGPRPHVAGQLAAGRPYRDVVPYYDFRYQMRPGLTGWAQANGLRGPTDNIRNSTSRITHDAAYIQNFTFMLDMRILVKTVGREFLNGNGF